MPLVRITLVDGVFTSEQKHAMAKDITDVMVKWEGSEAFRDVVWVIFEEMHRDGWHMGGEPFQGPPSLMSTLGRAAATYEAVGGKEAAGAPPATREEWAKVAPVKGGA
jgi:4-oxalocrotonate tautomerase